MKRTGICLVLSSLLLAGCANRIASTEFQREIPETKSSKESFSAAGEPDLLTSPQVQLTFLRIETRESRLLYVTTRTEEFTPYSGWRELYEVPSGIICLPFAVAFKVIDFLALGFIPDTQSDGFVSWSFAAMNPFMNVESKRRVVQEEHEEVTRETDLGTDTIKAPLANAPLHVRFNGTPAEELSTDDQGLLSFHLLDILPGRLEEPPRKLILTGAPGSEAADVRVEIFIDRTLAQRVQAASGYLLRFDASRYSVEYLANAIYQLDQLGFKSYSLRLEDRVIAERSYDPDDLQKFKTKLSQLYEVH